MGPAGRRVVPLVIIWSSLALAVSASGAPRHPSAQPRLSPARGGPHKRLARIPFEVERDRTIVRVRVGDSRPLRLILDTGMTMEGAYLFHAEVENEIGIDDALDVLVPGAGGGEPSPGVMAASVPMSAVDVIGEGSVPVECYIDFASGEAVELLVRDDAKFPIPEDLEVAYLGMGLSGDVHGGVGRVESFTMGSQTFHGVPAAFPPAAVRSKQEAADAVIGNQLLRRFNLVFDYDASTLWVRPNRSFEEPFGR